jgi:long-subunit fatty acid transport protein
MRIAAGIDYRFVNPLQAHILFDVSYDFWSRFKDSARPDLSLNDTYTIRTGIEHVFFDQVPLRVGFAFGLIPENKELTRTLLTLGTGYTTNIWEINVSGGVSSMEFFQDDLYAESIFGLDDRTESDRVKLTEYYVRMDLKVSVGSIF